MTEFSFPDTKSSHPASTPFTVESSSMNASELTNGTPPALTGRGFQLQMLLLNRKQKEDAEQVLMLFEVLFVALAIPATLCNIVIFTHRNMRSASSSYVIGISYAQLYYVISHSCNHVMGGFIPDSSHGLAYCVRMYVALYVVVYGSLVAQRTFYLLVCLMSLERLYAVVSPLHAKNFLLSKHSSLSAVAALLLSASWHVYLLTKYTIHRSTDDVYGSVCSFGRSSMYEQQREINDMFSLLTKIAMSYLTLLVQIVLNVLMIVALRQHNVTLRHVQTSANEMAREQRERRMTITILVTSICYVMLSLPAEINNILTSTVPGYTTRGKYANLYVVVNRLGFNLITLGCGVDFICFYLLSARYREMFQRLLCCHRGKKAGESLGARLGDTAETVETN